MTKQCNHISRSGPLTAGHRIGGASLGQCANECVPGLVVCPEHATKEALVLLIEQLTIKPAGSLVTGLGSALREHLPAAGVVLCVSAGERSGDFCHGVATAAGITVRARHLVCDVRGSFYGPKVWSRYEDSFRGAAVSCIVVLLESNDADIAAVLLAEVLDISRTDVPIFVAHPGPSKVLEKRLRGELPVEVAELLHFITPQQDSA